MEESVPREERNWAMVAHFGALIGYVVPFGNVVAPLAVWLAKREGSAFVGRHGRESLNFQLSIMTYLGMLLVLLVVGMLSGIPAGDSRPDMVFVLLLIPGMLGVHLFNAVSVIVAGVHANDGKEFHYALCIHYVR